MKRSDFASAFLSVWWSQVLHANRDAYPTLMMFLAISWKLDLFWNLFLSISMWWCYSAAALTRNICTNTYLRTYLHATSHLLGKFPKGHSLHGLIKCELFIWSSSMKRGSRKVVVHQSGSVQNPVGPCTLLWKIEARTLALCHAADAEKEPDNMRSLEDDKRHDAELKKKISMYISVTARDEPWWSHRYRWWGRWRGWAPCRWRARWRSRGRVCWTATPRSSYLSSAGRWRTCRLRWSARRDTQSPWRVIGTGRTRCFNEDLSYFGVVRVNLCSA